MTLRLVKSGLLLCMLVLAMAGPAQAGMHRMVAPMSATVLSVGDTIDGIIGEVGRWQSQLNRSLAVEVRNIKRGEGLPAILALLGLGFFYGVVHALGPGHGKAVVAAYFMDRSRHWSAAIFAGSWIALGHVVSALLVVVILTIVLGSVPLDALAQARLVEIVAYGLIVAIGLWRLLAGLRGAHHHHHHDHDHDHDHDHCDHAEPRHETGTWPGFKRRLREFLKPGAMLGMLTVAGAVPCSGAMILLLFSLANGMLAIGLLATAFIALGMALTLVLLGLGAVALRVRFVDGHQHGSLQRAMTIAGGALVTAVGGMMLAAVILRPL